jgi:TetR/AcrR family transcriptional repressor of nem operon
MRVSKVQAATSRQRIVEKSAELFREKGFDGIGIADLMKASGMTQGGFYRHFSSKEDLAQEATSAAYRQLETDTAGKSIEAILTQYISTGHRDDLVGSCPTSALGGDAMRQAEPVKAVFATGVETWLCQFDQALQGVNESSPDARRRLSIDLAARAIGAIVLSRASAAKSELSDEILETCLSEGLAAVAAHRLGVPQPVWLDERWRSRSIDLPVAGRCDSCAGLASAPTDSCSSC